MSDLRLRTLRAFGRAPSLRTAARKHAVPAVEPVEKPREAAKPKGHSVVDSAIYCGGRRVASPGSLAETYRVLHKAPQSLAWIGLYRPDSRELASLAAGVRPARAGRRGRDPGPPAAEARAVRRHAVRRAEGRALPGRRPRRSSSASCTCSSARTSWSRSGTPRRRTWPPYGAGWRATPSCSRRGTEAVLYAILDSVVDGYAPVVAGLENDIDEIETEVFRGDPTVSRRIYELSREVIEFQRATRPLVGMLDALTRRLRQVRRRRGTAALPARRRRPRHRGRRAGRRLPRSCCATSSPSTRPWSRSGRTRR